MNSMDTKLLISATAVLALIGLIVNVAVDLDNVYDMTLAVIWFLTLIVAAAAAMMGGRSKPAAAQPAQS